MFSVSSLSEIESYIAAGAEKFKQGDCFNITVGYPKLRTDMNDNKDAYFGIRSGSMNG